MAKQKIFHKYTAETKALADTRSLIVTISTDTPDRDGDVVVPKGVKLDNFLKNPVVLFGHKYDEPAIAKASDIVADDHTIKAKVTFPTKGVYPFADTIYDLIKEGIMNAWSIGFSVDKNMTERLESGGLKFNSSELLEFSAVPVPANAEALTVLRSKGISEDNIEDLAKELAEEAPVAPERLPEEKAVEDSKVEKGVSEVISLAWIIDDLNWLIYSFGKNEVNEETLAQMTDALVILLKVLKGQAVLGKKEFTIEPGVEAPVFPEIPEKASTEDLMKSLSALRDALKPADQGIGLLLREINSQMKKPTN